MSDLKSEKSTRVTREKLMRLEMAIRETLVIAGYCLKFGPIAPPQTASSAAILRGEALAYYRGQVGRIGMSDATLFHAIIDREAMTILEAVRVVFEESPENSEKTKNDGEQGSDVAAGGAEVPTGTFIDENPDLTDAEVEEAIRRGGDPLRPKKAPVESVECPKCHLNWVKGCEQAIAIRKRGKCIACLVSDREEFCMDPYEFARED